ncbi:MAG: FtsX-like permease family protein, partial [Lachnospiraceae bacterium]|nr:FtsX-like permease family protein [Lachnospiraceae bacterium]
NTVYTNIHTRVTEIGIKRAIGMSVGSLYRTFLWEGAYYGMIAAVTGSLTGYLCTMLMEAAMSNVLTFVPVPMIPILESAVVSVAACLAATALPLRQISRLGIVEAVGAVE